MNAMNPSDITIEEYLATLPGDRREAISAVLQVMRKNMPKGYAETMNRGMITWQVPLEFYPDTYNGEPLMYAALANQKHHMALYLCSVYADKKLRQQLEDGYAHAGFKLDCGVGCIRFRKLQHVPLNVIGRLAGALSVKEYVALTKRVQGARSK